MISNIEKLTQGDGFERHLERLRGVEVEAVRPWFHPGARVLDFGGGNGYQAGIMAGWGCDVVSIDLSDRAALSMYYPVQDYDGRRIPYAEETFDIVFSSNVLEHIRDLPSMLGEIRRILKPGGLAVHVLPSPTWRMWTSFGHYARLLKRLLDLPQVSPKPSNLRSANEAVGEHGLLPVVKRNLLISFSPHGEYPNALSEMWYFSRRRWSGVFEDNGFELRNVSGNELLYTSNVLLPGMSLNTRRGLARVMGDSCHIFVMHKPA